METSGNQTCRYCGNNPVPHFLNWYFESVDILFSPIRHVVLYSVVPDALGRLWNYAGMPLLLVRALRAVGAVRLINEKDTRTSARAVVLWESAQRRGIDMQEVRLFGRSVDAYIASKSGRTFVFSGLPRPDSSSGLAVEQMDDKAHLHSRLEAVGLPVPAGGSVTTLRGALKIFARVQKPVIVKPRAGSRGRHTTTSVRTEGELRAAFRVAKQLCFWVVVQEHLEGPVYRATCVGGRCVGVLRGDSPQVIGDGSSTVATLVSARNSAPHHGSSDIKLTDSTDSFLARSGLTRESVPSPGQVVYLSEKIGVSYGGSSSEDFEVAHPDNIELFERAATAVGDPIVGFDFIIPDVSKSWKAQRCGFLEANSLPFINLHHDPRYGTPRDVAAKVWELVGF